MNDGLIYSSYYEDNGIREACHNIKGDNGINRQKEAVESIASYLSDSHIADKGTVLIPAPQHSGRAEYTLSLARRVSENSGAKVLDIIKCIPHEPLYNTKYNREAPDVRFYLEGKIPENKIPLFLDNVISTGYTFEYCNRLCGSRLVPFIYAIDYSRIGKNIIRLMTDSVRKTCYVIDTTDKNRLILKRR